MVVVVLLLRLQLLLRCIALDAFVVLLLLKSHKDLVRSLGNVFVVGIILLKLEKSNRYRIVHLSLSCDCEKFMPAKW